MPDYSLSTWIGVGIGIALALIDALHPSDYFEAKVWRFTWGYRRTRRKRH